MAQSQLSLSAGEAYIGQQPPAANASLADVQRDKRERFCAPCMCIACLRQCMHAQEGHFAGHLPAERLGDPEPEPEDGAKGKDSLADIDNAHQEGSSTASPTGSDKPSTTSWRVTDAADQRVSPLATECLHWVVGALATRALWEPLSLLFDTFVATVHA